MRIAVAYENGQVFQHFGHTERFKVYDIEDGKIVTATTINTNGSGHGALANILKKIQVATLICGGIGDGAKRALAEAGIELYSGVSGDSNEAVEALLVGNLIFNSNSTCAYSGEHHDNNFEEHTCRSIKKKLE